MDEEESGSEKAHGVPGHEPADKPVPIRAHRAPTEVSDWGKRGSYGRMMGYECGKTGTRALALDESRGSRPPPRNPDGSRWRRPLEATVGSGPAPPGRQGARALSRPPPRPRPVWLPAPARRERLRACAPRPGGAGPGGRSWERAGRVWAGVGGGCAAPRGLWPGVSADSAGRRRGRL